MADVSLVCVREDTWKADLLSAALERYGFTVCRSASVFEDFTGYAAVVVLLSPGAARSDLVMGTAARALDWGKLIPVFVNLCRLPDRLAGVALHDLAMWDGDGADPVVKAIAYHAQRLAGLPGRPDFGPDASPRRLGHDSEVFQQPRIDYDQGAYGYAQQQHQQPSYVQVQHHQPYDFESNYGRSYNAPREPLYITAAHNELDHYAPPARDYMAPPVDVHVAVSPNDAARRRAYMIADQTILSAPTFHGPSSNGPSSYSDHHILGDRSSFSESHHTLIDYDTETVAPRRPGRPMPGLFTVVISAFALLSMTWFEEARTREYVEPHATPAVATADLSAPTSADPGDAPRQTFSEAR